jgi:hypothetical protein
MRPTVEELAELAKRWKSYRGEDIRADQISAWLEQFGTPKEQRLVMPIIEGLRFYTRSKMDGHMRDLHQFVLRELATKDYEYTISGRQRLRDDFLVCGLEGGGSGAAHLLKRYRDENGIYSDCVVDPSNVRRALDGARQEIRAIIVLDDFIGTGETAATRLRELHRAWTEDGEWPDAVDVFLLAISAFDSGLSRVERTVRKLEWPVTIRASDVLGNEDRCFHEQSRFFSDANAQDQARVLCERFGALAAKFPLGFGKTQAAVCFEYRCPNNSLSVLWADSPNWTPLFPRH